jgi:PilZ domain-containing protein
VGNRDETKRVKERIPARGHLHGEVMVYQPMTIVDISHGGAQVETPFPLQLDSLHQFRLTLGDISIIVRGRIAHCRVGDLREAVAVFRSGIEFVEPSPHVLQAISSFVEALTASKPIDVVVDGELLDDAAGG